MTIYATLLSQGYFPKELPPAFFTEDFSNFARTRAGRAALVAYRPQDDFTECGSYRLALSGQNGVANRPLHIPHPHAYAALARLVAQHFRRLLKKAGASPISRSRPVFQTGQQRAIRTLFRPSSLSRARAESRAGATHLLKADVSQFYPSLYTHAIGWAIDPKLRQRAHWKNTRLIGWKVDQRLMRLQGKVSQGIPIGNDVSFLLAELVLSQVDKGLGLPKGNGYRWYDDYEIACSSRRDAEEVLGRLTALLDSFKLRLNPLKTQIVDLPLPAGETWHEQLHALSSRAVANTSGMVAYFDRAFELRQRYPEQPVLTYAIGALFALPGPAPVLQRVAESCVSQALLSEPGCAQKAFALLTFWELNGSSFDRSVFVRTIEKLLEQYASRGFTSDATWALAFVIQHMLILSRAAGRALSRLTEDPLVVQALHAHRLNLLPAFSVAAIERALKDEHCDGPHWLLLYEGTRQGHFSPVARAVRSNALMSGLLAASVAFYREQMPSYAMLLHPGGAPDWVVRAWMEGIAKEQAPPAPQSLGDDLTELATDETLMDLVRKLLDKASKRIRASPEPYE